MPSYREIERLRRTPEFRAAVSDPVVNFMMRIAETPGHPELVHQYRWWSLLVQPEQVRQSMRIHAAGILASRAFIDGENLFVAREAQLPATAKIELFDIVEDASLRLLSHAGTDPLYYRGYDGGYHSAGVDRVRSSETGRSVEPLHVQLFPKTPFDIYGGTVQGYQARHREELQHPPLPLLPALEI